MKPLGNLTVAAYQVQEDPGIEFIFPGRDHEFLIKRDFWIKSFLVKISPLTVLRLTSTRHRTYPAAFTSAIVGGKGEVMCIVVEGVEHADQLTLNLKTR